ncbi:hypothetical protein ACFV1A_10805 [Streptomyces seoulensis]|uniref:Uncharacterized protein n=1 Tax=Streptomyces seoulensis TaxID=73044 RepID=A0A4P6TSR3_STRSO|nr:hypothetical protein [Streptomyces seoulensis]QBJ89251.1 hypothetical protein D0Z67_02285 [Streptomyces seoulensis]
MRGGAWPAHSALGLPVAAAGPALLWCVAYLDDRLGARFVRGERTGAWVLSAALLACGAGAVFVVACAHQL